MADNMRDMTLNLIVNSQVNRIKEFNKNLKDTEQAIDRTTQKTGWLSRNLGRIFITYFGVQGIKNMVNTHRKLDMVQRSLNALTGSAEAGARHFEFLKNVAFGTATNLMEVANAYRGYYYAAKTAGLSDEQLQHSFYGVTMGARVLGSTPQQVKGAMLALEQMMNKTVVQAEEMNRQLTNAISGARELSAEAMGMSVAEFTEKMQKKQIKASEFVVKFGDYMYKQFKDKLPEALKSLDASVVNLQNAWILFQHEVVKGGIGAELTKLNAALMKIILSPNTRKIAISVAKSLGVIANVLLFLIEHLKQILFFISPLVMGAAIDKLIKSVAVLVGWIRAGNLALSITQRWMLLIFAGIVMLDEIIALFQKGRKSVIKTVLFGEDGVSGAMRIVGALSLIATTLISIAGALAIINKFKGIASWLFPHKEVPKPNTTPTNVPQESSIIDPRTNKGYKTPTTSDITRNARIKNTALKMGAKVGAKAGLRAFGEYLAILPFSIGAMQDIYGGGDKKRADDVLKQIMEIETRRKNNWTRDFANANLTKSETYAPNINYNPNYYIDATGLTPEELRDVLDERDRNFWSSLNRGMPSVTSKGGGYSSLFPLSGGGKF